MVGRILETAHFRFLHVMIITRLHHHHKKLNVSNIVTETDDYQNWLQHI